METPDKVAFSMQKMEMNRNILVAKNAEEKDTFDTSSMSTPRIMKNHLVLCFTFLLVYSEFQALTTLQNTMNMEGNVGLTSQCIYCICVMVSSLFFPKLVIEKFGCKSTMVLCILMYMPFVLANLYPHMGILVPAVIIQSLGAAPLFAAKSTYFSRLSVLHAKLVADDADVIIAYYFGIFFTMFQSAHIWGNLISYYVLKPFPNNETIIFYDPAAALKFNVTVDICGVDYCNGENEILKPPPEDKRYMLIGIFCTVVILASLLITVFLDPLERDSMIVEDDGGVLLKVIATLKHLRKLDMLLLVPLTIFLGIEQSFIFAEYSKAYIACSWGVHNIGRVFICFGVANVIVSYVAGRLVKYVPRWTLMTTGAVSNGGAMIALFVWKPNNEEYVYFFLTIGAWGLSDAIWLTQINALYGSLFRSEEEAAFSNYVLWISFGYALSYSYSPFLCMAAKIYILMFSMFAGMVGYTVVEFRMLLKNRNYEVNK